MATTFADMARRFRAFDVSNEGKRIILEHGPELTDYNRLRLMKGLGTNMQFLPRYEDDPYFITHGGKKAAYGYAMWKASINSKAPFGVMTFYINGYTHNRIRLEVKGEAVGFEALVPWGDDIQKKTSGQALGLSDDDKYYFRRDHLHPTLARRLAAFTGAKI